VIDESERIINENLSDEYKILTGNNLDQSNSTTKNYYTAVLLNLKTCKYLSHNLVPFANSIMGRNLLMVKFNYKRSVDVCAMTSHLESTKDYAVKRLEQLKLCFDKIKEQEKKFLVFFGGDLNLRDKEVKFVYIIS
jgi:tyrosyl-DNA phosphodiesterase 2